jgi:hypothetical protein
MKLFYFLNDKNHSNFSEEFTMKARSLFFSFLFSMVLLPYAIFAQGTSSIRGTVTDINGAVVAGATVKATNEATGVTYTQTTNDSGLYAFPLIPVGKYTVTVEQTNFKKFVKTGNALEVDTPLSVNIVLEAGAITETVTVTGGAEQLQTADATISNVVEQKAIEALPLNGRNPLTLITFEPGVTQRSAGAAGSGIHVNGSRDRAYNVTIDGIEANESSVPNPVNNLYRLTPDNVQEFKVTTNNATAEQGRNSGASISVATRSGSNQFHGTGFYFIRDDRFNSKEFYANAQNQPKREIKLDQYGFEVGGPIIKKKMFFFGSLQINKIDFTQPIDQSFGIPILLTAQARQGNLRYFRADPANPLVIDGVTITRNSPLLVDPVTGNLRAGVDVCTTATQLRCVATYNIITNSTLPVVLDPSILAYINRTPLPNSYRSLSTSIDGLNTATYLWNPPTQVKGPAIAARIDHNFNENNSIFGRFLYSKYDTLKGDPLNGRPQLYPGFPPLGEVFRETSNLALNYRRVISPNIVNELTLGYARFNFLFSQGEANPDFPNILPVDLNLTSEPLNLTPRTQRIITTPQVKDDLTVVMGSHVFKFGFNARFYRHVDRRGQPGGVDLTPLITFSAATRNPFTTTGGYPTTPFGINSSDTTGFIAPLINNLLGRPAQIRQIFIGNLNTNGFLPFRTGNNVTLFAEKHIVNQYNFYAQDEWKIRPNFTLNYGFRLEINPPGSTAGGNTYVASTPITQTLTANRTLNTPGPVTFVKADSWYAKENYAAIGPSIGFAWSPNYGNNKIGNFFLGEQGKSVIRAGYRVAFDTISSFQITAAAGRVPGLLQTCSSSFPFTTITPGCSAIPEANRTSTISGGFPQQLAPPTATPQLGLTPALQFNADAPPITVFAPVMKIPTVHQWSLSVQRELPLGFVMQAAYVGRRGNRLFNAYNINQIDSGPILDSFLIMRQNRLNGCRPDGLSSTGGACVGGNTNIPLVGQLLAAGISAPTITSFINGTNVVSDLSLNAAGTFAERLENRIATPQVFLPFRLRPNQQFSTITYLDNLGDSNYHALQVTLRRRFASGLGLNMSYTWGKSIDNQSVDPVGAASGGGLSTTNSRTPTNGRNFRQERGRSDFDRTHLFTISSVYELPFGKGRKYLSSPSGFVNHIIGNWSFNTIFYAMSGEPFSVRSGVRTANAAHESRAALVDLNARAQLQPSASSTVAGPVFFRDASAFALPEPGQDGAGRNIFVASPYWNLDIGITKYFYMTERIKLQFRMEMFNALNHPNFDNPRDASVGSPSFRSSVFAQACCTTVAPPSTQTIIQTGESARVIQFALKLQW